ncbi:MAG: M24 family metallopeptidase [Crenarchaeota archaeon]|nr:M24 family metallopeptidase [Thermoproteota archaeon]
MRNIEAWKEVGRVAGEILRKAVTLVKPGVRLLELCDKIEDLIREAGYRPAFPVNISINEVVAHYTATPFDFSEVSKKALVKLDLGVLHPTSGAIADTAVTVSINLNGKVEALIKATQRALEKAIELTKDGIRVGEIGNIISKEAHEEGFGVLVDLGGHSLEEYKLHSGILIPNVPRKFTPKLRAGMIIAIEPFLVASSMDSYTRPNMAMVGIYSIKNPGKDKVLEMLHQNFRTLPFTLRWIDKARAEREFYDTIHKHLLACHLEGKVNIYPALVEARNRLVAQFEHTILVGTNSAEILTAW